jgi:hypothetical protein
LTDTAEEIALLEKLYNLYQKVTGTFLVWDDLPWAEVNGELAKMIETTETFQKDCIRLPGPLKKWLTYSKL